MFWIYEIMNLTTDAQPLGGFCRYNRDMGAAQRLNAQIDDVAVLRDIENFYANASKAESIFIGVPISLIDVEKMPDVALHLRQGTGSLLDPSSFKIFRAQGLYMSPIEIETLKNNGVKFVYIPREDLQKFTVFVERLLAELPTSSPLADEKKCEILRGSAIQVMGDILDKPTPENIEKGVKVVSGFVYMLMKDPKAYGLLLGLSSHDHYTLQHSVGAATNAIILAQRSGITDEKVLIDVGVGGLLHDVGKTKVPKEIINKTGPLDAEEWAVMKQHSMFGYEILKDNPNVSMKAKLAVLQHHEDNLGTGYPIGLRNEQVDQFAKIVAISDIYNAITTDRSYSKARSPFDAFQLIRDKLAHKVDPRLFEIMVKIYGGK